MFDKIRVMIFLAAALVMLATACSGNQVNNSSAQDVSDIESQSDLARSDSESEQSSKGIEDQSNSNTAADSQSIPQQSAEDDNGENFTFADIANGEVAYSRLTTRDLDYLEMTDKGDPETIVSLHLNDEFMGFTLNGLVHTEVFVDNEWHDVALRAEFEGLVSLEGDLYISDYPYFEMNETSYERVPGFAYHGTTITTDHDIAISDNDVWSALIDLYEEKDLDDGLRIEGVSITLHMAMICQYGLAIQSIDPAI